MDLLLAIALGGIMTDRSSRNPAIAHLSEHMLEDIGVFDPGRWPAPPRRRGWGAILSFAGVLARLHRDRRPTGETASNSASLADAPEASR